MQKFNIATNWIDQKNGHESEINSKHQLTKNLTTEKNEKVPKKIESKEYFYSQSLDIYISRQPLKVDERVVKAASECWVSLSWDDEWRIKDVNYLEAKKLSTKLWAKLLSPTEFWKVYFEAIDEGRQDVIDLLQSDKNTEWLDAVYKKDKKGDVYMIEHPEIVETTDGVLYKWKMQKIDMKEGRPGWFNPRNNIDINTGMPIQIDTERVKGTSQWSSVTWKYWSVFKINEYLSPIRWYVTSSGTPSFDLDIPVEAKQSVLMLRECRKELLDPAIDSELQKKADYLINEYISTTVKKPAVQNPKEHQRFYEKKDKFMEFFREYWPQLVNSNHKEAQKIKEKIIDILGAIYILAKTKGDDVVVAEVENITKELFKIEKRNITIQDITQFVIESKNNLKKALKDKKRIVFVMWHKNPDTDTGISCLIEAYRNSIISSDVTFIPVIQGSVMPDEIRKLVWDKISDATLFTDEPDYQIALDSWHARWILVDQNVSDIQRYAISIVDHHILSEKSKQQDISTTWEMAGSTTALIAQKLYGMWVKCDKETSKILYWATLMDTENRSKQKVTYKDNIVMNDLQQTAWVATDNQFYQDLMSSLLNTDNAELLFQRDYKQDWGIFGFAVAKVKNTFDTSWNTLKKDLLDRLVNLAHANNLSKNFPLTIIKLVDYLENNETVNKERVYLIFNQYVLEEFKQKIFELIDKIIKYTFGPKVQIAHWSDYIDFWWVWDQLSRKVTAPYIEPVVNAYNEYYFSPSTNLYIKRDFLKTDKKIKTAARELGIELSVDKVGRVNNVTYYEAKKLVEHLGLKMMSAKEYWKIRNETKQIHDEQLEKHLVSQWFVEFLDTIILDKTHIIDHPTITWDADNYSYKWKKRPVTLLEAVPGLIHPDDIDLDTWFPKQVKWPHLYGDKTLWRYWSPDTDVAIPTRWHIFLLDQPALDTKIHPNDALPNLGRFCSFLNLYKIQIFF